MAAVAAKRQPCSEKAALQPKLAGASFARLGRPSLACGSWGTRADRGVRPTGGMYLSGENGGLDVLELTAPISVIATSSGAVAGRL